MFLPTKSVAEGRCEDLRTASSNWCLSTNQDNVGFHCACRIWTSSPMRFAGTSAGTFCATMVGQIIQTGSKPCVAGKGHKLTELTFANRNADKNDCLAGGSQKVMAQPLDKSAGWSLLLPHHENSVSYWFPQNWSTPPRSQGWSKFEHGRSIPAKFAG